MPKFLSSEWLDLQARLGAALPEVAGTTTTVEHVVPGAPDGEVRYVLSYVDGRIAAATLGADPDAEVSMTVKYPDAVKLLTGELDANAQFMAGRTKVTGPTGPLLAVLALDGSAEHERFRTELAAGTEV